MKELKLKYEKGRNVWDSCSEIYEKQIVKGHPDITAFERFEEDFLDFLLRHLITNQERKIKLMDIGCGSGRLHMRYGFKTVDTDELSSDYPHEQVVENNPDLLYDPILANGLSEVWGIDFSAKMLEIAQKKIDEPGFPETATAIDLSFEQGSAFELEAPQEDVLPFAISLVNSIGVMQGPIGAQSLFKSMRDAVVEKRGIAIISCYRKEYFQYYGIGQYESTLDVSGQPKWMAPDKFANNGHKLVPKEYKLAYSNEPTIVVDVVNDENKIVEKNFVLERNPEVLNKTINTGHIETYNGYESNWYSFEQIDEWINKHWTGYGSTYHIKTCDMDNMRAEPAQWAILDCGDYLGELLKIRKWVK